MQKSSGTPYAVRLHCFFSWQTWEDRPYREGMPHAKAVGIMRDLAVSGRIDANIVRDVQSVFGG